MDTLIDQLSQSVTTARNVEGLTRPLLEMLEAVMGLESTYLTTIDLEAGVQHVLYARNTQQMQIPEGLTAPWSDTLCKRALDEGRMFTNDVAGCWGDSEAAAALGLQTYVSAPVHTSGGALYGTLCAASTSRHETTPQARRVLLLFARLIGQQVEREQLMRQLLAANERLAAHATTDALTGLPNRRALMQALTRQLAQGARRYATVLVAFLDLDGFKGINDRHGHEAGDQFLAAVAQRLQGALRAEDFVARLGGDEFVLIGPGPAPGNAVEPARRAFTQRIAEATAGRFDCAGAAIDYAGASVGAIAVAPHSLTAEAALREADRAMYAAKRARKVKDLP
jgi:diguanylate cyclase